MLNYDRLLKLKRGQIVFISSGILIASGFIIIIFSGFTINSIVQSVSIDQIAKTFTGNILGNVFDRSGNTLEFGKILTNESAIILGISVVGVLAGIVLIVNGIILIIVGIIVTIYDRRKSQTKLKDRNID